MIITHASAEKIEKVEASHIHSNALKGCLFFASEGNTYNLANDCNFQYNIEINEDNVINTNRFFYEHETTEQAVQEVLEMMRNDVFGFDEMSDAELSELLDETTSTNDLEQSEDASFNCDKSWAVQQYQGILAHKLGYDCAESFDEQGTVYIAYCVNRELNEVEI